MVPVNSVKCKYKRQEFLTVVFTDSTLPQLKLEFGGVPYTQVRFLKLPKTLKNISIVQTESFNKYRE